MATRRQIARLLPLVLLVVLVIAGLRGTVPAPRWNGPLQADGVAIAIVLEVIFVALLLAVYSRDRAARRAKANQPYAPRELDVDFEAPQALRFTLKYVLWLGILGIAGLIIGNLHLHFFTKGRLLPTGLQKLQSEHASELGTAQAHGWSFHLPVTQILYALLITAIIAAVAVSIWWSTRLRNPAVPPVIEDVDTEELREAVEEGRSALQQVDDARAAIIACYVAMERSLADRGTARAVAETPDELLARAVASGTVRGAAAGRLTSLFYEARFSTHPLSDTQRDAASTALDEIAAELAERKPKPAPKEPEPAAGQPRPGGGWV